MTVFKIIASHSEKQIDSSEFIIQPISGEIRIGDTFVCFDTHHPKKYVVKELESIGEERKIICKGSLGFDQQFIGAIVDTSTRQRSAAFRYVH